MIGRCGYLYMKHLFWFRIYRKSEENVSCVWNLKKGNYDYNIIKSKYMLHYNKCAKYFYSE